MIAHDDNDVMVAIGNTYLQVWFSDDGDVWLSANLLPGPLHCHLRSHLYPLKVSQ